MDNETGSEIKFFQESISRSNYKNICQTVAKKHQLWQCFNFLKKSNLFYPTPEISSKILLSEVQLESEYVQQEMQKHFHALSPNETTTHPSWVKQYNFTYKKGIFLFVLYDIMFPKFGKIVDIVICNYVIIFTLEVYVTDYIQCHYNAFSIKSTSKFFALTLNFLEHKHPLQTKQSFDSSDHCKYIISPFFY